MNSDPSVGVDAGDGADLGEIIRFTVVDHGPDAAVLHAAGELDTLTSPLLQARMLEQLAEVHRLVLDLTDVTFLGSAGLAALMAAREDARRRGHLLLVVPGSRIVRRALEVTGLLGQFTIVDGVPEALESNP